MTDDEEAQKLDDKGYTIDLCMNECEDGKFKIIIHNLNKEMFEKMLQRILKRINSTRKNNEC